MTGLAWILLFGLPCLSLAEDRPPKVQLYSRTLGEYGKKNTLICHASEFQPPEIIIELLKNGKVMPEATLSEMTFTQTWQYHVNKYVPFTPNAQDVFSCRVKHLGKENTYEWEADA